MRARAPIVTGGTGLRFHHVLEACRRSRAIGAAYRDVVATARASVVLALEHQDPDRDAQGRADMLVAIVLGMLAVNELELPVDLDRLERAMLDVVS